MNSKFMEIKLDIRKVTEITEKADALTSANHNEILQWQAYGGELKKANKSVSASLDDQINCYMRSTLIFKGLKEEPCETWDQTERFLTEVISRHLKLDVDQTSEMIECAHRGRQSSDGKGPRHIYIKFFSWKDSETVKNGFLIFVDSIQRRAFELIRFFPKK